MAGGRRALLERDRELGAIQEALDAAAEGSGRTFVIEADAGMGKSSLLRAAADIASAADREIRVLRAEGTSHEQALAFGGALQLFDPLLRRSSPAERASLLAGPAELARGLLTGADLPDIPQDQVALSIIHGLYWLTLNLCLPADGPGDGESRPVLVLVDDAHLLDPGTAGYLLYLSRRLTDVPLSMIVAARPPSPTSPAELADLIAGADLHLRPGLLSLAAVERLIAEQFHDGTAPFSPWQPRAT